MTMSRDEMDMRAAQLDQLAEILKPLDIVDTAPDGTSATKHWEFNDGSQSKTTGPTMRFHSDSMFDHMAVATAFQNAGIEIAFAKKDTQHFLMLPEESFHQITANTVSNIARHVAGQVIAKTLNEGGLGLQTETAGDWTPDAGKGAVHTPNVRVNTPTVVEGLDMALEAKEKTGLNAVLRHKDRTDGGTQYMVVIEVDTDPVRQLETLAAHTTAKPAQPAQQPARKRSAGLG